MCVLIHTLQRKIPLAKPNFIAAFLGNKILVLHKVIP